MDTPRVAKREWNPEAQLDELMLETKYDDGDAAATCARLLRENAMIAAQSIAHLAAYAQQERIRLQASTYILDKVLAGDVMHDFKMKQEQIALVGQALFAVVRELGIKYGFDPDSPEVKAVAHETMVALASRGEEAA